MRIVLLPKSEGDAIAWEEQFGQREGQFDLSSAGTVVYRNRADDREWFAGINVAQFREAAEAWNDYSSAVAGVFESEQDALVKQLRDELDRIDVLDSRLDSLWSVLLEQAESGML
jgi:hypothetical protein